MMKLYRRFTYVFLATTLAPVLGIGLFNFAIDPYGIFNSIELDKINSEKPEKVSQDRLFKALDITRLKPEIVVLGSSRVQWGIDTRHPIFNLDQNPYNLGLNGVSMYEILRYFEHTQVNQKNLNLAIIGTDLIMFLNKDSENTVKTFKEERLGKTGLTFNDLKEVLFSLNVSYDSYKTISKNQYARESFEYFERGFYVRPKETSFPGSVKNFNKWIKKDWEKAWQSEGSIKISEENLQITENLIFFEKLVEIAQNQEIDLYVFIPPVHAIYLEKYSMEGSWSGFENLKRQLVKIAPVWDFSGYNSITTEPIQEQMNNYIDSSHYSKEVGDLILNRIFDYQTETVPDDFGVLLTPDNIEAHLEKIRRDRELWVKNNPEAVQLLLDIKSEVAGTEKN